MKTSTGKKITVTVILETSGEIGGLRTVLEQFLSRPGNREDYPCTWDDAISLRDTLNRALQ